MERYPSKSKLFHLLRMSCIGLRGQLDAIRDASTDKETDTQKIDILESDLIALKKEYLEHEFNSRLDKLNS